MPVQQTATHNYTETTETRMIGPQTIEEIIRQKARLNNLDEEKIIFIAKCESQLDPNALGDGNLICKSTGNPMRSRGIWQINECGHSEVTDEQAFDIEWSTDWAISVFKEGNEAKEWRRCTQQYTKLTVVKK